MKIYVGKSRKKAKEITLKQLLIDSLHIEDKDTEINSDRFADDSASWLDIERKLHTVNKGVRVDVHLGFNPENDNEIIEFELYSSNKLSGYDEENMKKLK